MRVYHEEYMRVSRNYPRQTKAVETAVRRLRRAEQKGETNLDVAAGTTGDMVGEIFVVDEDDVWARDLREMGFYLGKFIYLMDAYEDMDDDRKTGSYNVLMQMRTDNRSEFDEMSRAILVSMMSKSARAFERMPIVLYAKLLRNIVYSGVWTKFEIIRAQNRKKEEKAKKKEQESGRGISKLRAGR